mgnify:CR=1 FL=1
MCSSDLAPSLARPPAALASPGPGGHGNGHGNDHGDGHQDSREPAAEGLSIALRVGTLAPAAEAARLAGAASVSVTR